jgi:phosphoribosylanthranilate isomerase
MVNGVQVKVCGLTSLKDAEAAYAGGADYLGFIQYKNSPRYLPLEKYREMLPDLPPLKKVGVLVYSSIDELEQHKDAGFDHIQLHFPNETPFFEVAIWSELIPPPMLWLAPRVPPGKDLDPAFLPLSDTFVFDTYNPIQMGGTGQVGDWYEFYRLQGLFQRIMWVLAGGLNPDNIAAAIKDSDARVVDVNSGIESAPGVKDHAKMKAFFDAIKSIPAPKAR